MDTIQGLDNIDPPQPVLDFTFWPKVAVPHDHVGLMVQCDSEVVVRLHKDTHAAGSITLEQIEQNGLHLEVGC